MYFFIRLTSPSASSAENLTNVDATGKVSSSIYSTSTLAVRPVVAIPSNILVQRNSQDLWQTGSNDIDSLKPTITLNTHSWAREVIVTIGYPYVEGIQREYSLTGEDGDWKTYTGPITLNKVEEEGKTIYARSVVGYNTATTSLTITNLDSAEPKELSLTAANLSTSTGKVVLTGTAKDSDSVGIQGWQITTDGEKTFDSDGWNPVSSKADITQTFDTINKGTYYFYVKDKVGVSKTSVVVDDTHFEPMKPTVTSGNEKWTNQDVTITVGNNKVPGVKYTYSTDNGSNWNDLNSENSFKISTDGDYTNKIKVKAALGNATKDSDTTTVKLCKAVPSISFAVGSITGTDNWTYASPTVNVTVPSLITSLTRQYSLDGGSSWNDFTGDTFSVPNTTETDYTDKVKMRTVLDTNVYNNSNVLSCKIDKTAPTADSGGSHDIPIKDSGGSGLKEISFRNLTFGFSGGWSLTLFGVTYGYSASSTATSGSYTFSTPGTLTTGSSVQIDSNSSGGTTSVYLTIKDFAGNTSTYYASQTSGGTNVVTKQ